MFYLEKGKNIFGFSVCFISEPYLNSTVCDPYQERGHVVSVNELPRHNMNYLGIVCTTSDRPNKLSRLPSVDPLDGLLFGKILLISPCLSPLFDCHIKVLLS